MIFILLIRRNHLNGFMNLRIKGNISLRNFLDSMIPTHEKVAHEVVMDMVAASRMAGTGPMSAVAGAIAEYVGRHNFQHFLCTGNYRTFFTVEINAVIFGSSRKVFAVNCQSIHARKSGIGFNRCYLRVGVKLFVRIINAWRIVVGTTL